MRFLPLLAVLTMLTASGAALAQSSYQTTYPTSPPPAPHLSFKIFVDSVDVIAIQGSNIWLVHDAPSPRAGGDRATVYVNGQPWLPVFENATCPCFSRTFNANAMMGNVPPDATFELRVNYARGLVKIEEQPSTGAGVLRLRFEDHLDGGDWYTVEAFPPAYPNPDHTPPPEEMKIRLLVDGASVLSMRGKEGWLEIREGPIPASPDAMLWINGVPFRPNFGNQTACPCKSTPFPLPFPAEDEGIPADGVGSIYFVEGRGAARIIQQPRDGQGIFALVFEDMGFAGSSWYTVGVGPDRAYYDPGNCTATNPDGTTAPCPQPACPAPPPESSTWTEAQRKDWYAANCAPPPVCAFPPEAQYWTEEQRREYAYRTCTPQNSSTCAFPPEAQYWTDQQRYDFAMRNCPPPPSSACQFPPDSSYWTVQQRNEWAAKYCPPTGSNPSSACQLPPEASSWTEEAKRAYLATRCGSGMSSDQAIRDAINKLAQNESARDAAQKAVGNASDQQKIVVPGFEPALAILGLAALAFVAGRRRLR